MSMPLMDKSKYPRQARSMWLDIGFFFEIANSAHTLSAEHESGFEAQLPPGMPVISVNNSKFDSRMNAEAYILRDQYIQLQS
jgi:hypothetical protein